MLITRMGIQRAYIVAGIVAAVTAAATTAALAGRARHEQSGETNGLLGIESAHPYLSGDWVVSKQRPGRVYSTTGRHQRRWR